ncbi:MAG: 50S ribosomal protein L21 [Omnitrophica bacterium RBG_13_46_9]|nr:MAG: 50S ribosomal protein L21 [Omnitrophica bacterium RBG_13_46_9]
MYVILETGGKQYKLEKNDEFLVNRIPSKLSSMVKLKNILLAKEKTSCQIGAPYIKDAFITCEVLLHTRGKKVIAFKYKRRKSQKRKVGHRQDLTKLRVKEIHISA